VYSNKRFVYRADSKDDINAVAERIHQRFPAARMNLITNGSLASINAEMLKKSTGQEIVIVELEPSCEEETRGQQRVYPEKLKADYRDYYRCNNTDIFALTNAVDGKRTFFYTEERFPGTRRRLEVIKEVSKK